MATFDKYGRLLNENFRTQNLSSFPSSSSYSYTNSRSWWQKVNDFVAGIGDWISDNEDALSSNISMGVFILSWVGFACGVISIWVDEGFFWALLAGLIGGGIFYYVSMLLFGAYFVILKIFLVIARYIFYNAYTLLIPVILFVLMLISVGTMALSYSSSSPSKQDTYSSVAETTNYICTAKSSLNVRYTPNANSRVVGSLRPRQVVEVYGMVNGFAKIKHETGVAYVSLKYLEKVSR